MRSIMKFASQSYLFSKFLSQSVKSTSEVGSSIATVIPAYVTMVVLAPGFLYTDWLIPARDMVSSMYGTALKTVSFPRKKIMSDPMASLIENRTCSSASSIWNRRSSRTMTRRCRR